MQTALLVLNLVASLASAAWGVVALVRPGSPSSSSNVERGETFYVRMYAARSIPFGLAAGFLPFWVGGKAIAWLLFTAAAIQVADVLIGVERKEKGMIVGASIGATVHILCGLKIY
ncbi:MAG: hypothetical protein M3Y72_12265 [Acidobacteriota bacterium]|nr:hypothetical protein [Acidobacteriota bacterium]